MKQLLFPFPYRKSFEIPVEVKRIFLKVALEAKLAKLFGFPSFLFELDQVCEWMGLKGIKNFGIKAVNLTQVVGANQCCHEFDRAFRPKNSNGDLRTDWEHLATYISWGAVPKKPEFYQWGEAFFVTSTFDGILVSVLKTFRYKTIEAHIVGPIEAQVPPPTIELLEYWEREVKKSY